MAKKQKKEEWKKYIEYKVSDVEHEPISGAAKAVLDIAIKKHTPITDEEKAIAKDLREAKAKGYIIDLPFE